MSQLKMTPQEAVGRIRFDSERQLFDALRGDSRIAQVAEKVRHSNQEDTTRRRLLANALRVTDRIIPSLTKRIALVKRMTHLEGAEVETFIYSSPQQSASCMRLENGDVVLLISSGLYTSLTERELLFVVGHEFGHVVYNHHQLPARAILAQQGGCDAELALKLMAWSRRAEISADRVGLLCCQDLNVAAKAFIKLSSGLSDELDDFDLQGYISQVEDLEAVSQTVRAAEDLYSTHPFNPIRIVALNRFWQSHTLCDLLGHSAATHSDQEVDSRIHELLKFMDPDAATIGNINSIACLVWGGALVAASDGHIDRAEVETLAKSVNSEVMNKARTAIHNAADPMKLIREQFSIAAQKGRHLPPPQRHAIVQQLVAVANSNGSAAAAEKTALQQICTALDVSPVFPEKIQTQYMDEFFAQMG